eukprot:1986595-Alexandrium_andersonii.AAC.1
MRRRNSSRWGSAGAALPVFGGVFGTGPPTFGGGPRLRRLSVFGGPARELAGAPIFAFAAGGGG